MKKHLYAILWVICVAMGFYLPSHAQSVTIDPSNLTAGNAIEATSTKKGILMPRMTEAQRNAISSPVAGIQIYCTNCSGGAGAYTYNGAVWVPMFNTAGITYSIGQSAQGGKIFYVDDTGQHGLVVATADYNASQQVKWIAASNINTNAVRSGIFGGEYNTQRINEVQGNGISAALAAARFDGGNYGDWYLPSKLELLLMYQQRANIGMGAVTNTYWSSTEVAAEYGNVSETAWFLNFNTGGQSSGAKSSLYRVRPIRRF
ncbi:DUF1566 domain-containing protein [Emticicia sp. BO119]|uniref:Lcl C-terminal domain-containing protein n=1 Tax=Emticicia sp. BO119 TaxID=2757768 RepID=UPI0015F0FFC0|nr:DUF1566 domain-containing protein [Emticicia sp. BO119]MBA4852338.1 DUF1566 domain-containing protein [Emticicia sp. BO119]